MTTLTADTPPLIRARVAGFLYLLLFFAPFGLIYVPSRLIVRGDAAATATNIMTSELLFCLGIVSNLLHPLVMILLVLALYQLFKPVNTYMVSLMVLFVLIAVPIAIFNEINQLAVLLILRDGDYLKEFTTDQLHSLVMFFLDLHRRGLLIAHIFWGLWMFPLGFLVFKSRFLPRILGVLLIIGCFGYVIQSFAAFLLPSYKLNLIFYTSRGETVTPVMASDQGHKRRTVGKTCR